MHPSHRRRSLPPSLSSIRSEFGKLCDELGGPADIGVTLKEHDLELYCAEYPLSSVQRVLTQFQDDATSTRQHWPWAAFALGQYIFERRERVKYTDELKPEEIRELLSQVARSAHDLASALCQLQKFANRLTDPTAPLRRAHLAWLDAFITQAAAGRISNEVGDDDGQMVIDFFEKMNLLKRLAHIEAAAMTATKHVDPTLLKRERGQSDPALPIFVFRCSKIWKSLTGREPSAEKVYRRDGPSDPDFVVFVQELVKVGQAPVPSRSQIATSLRRIRNDSR